MAHEVIMPALGMAQETGLLVSWLKSVGDAVAADDILMEVETDKSTMEVPAGADGFISELRAKTGQDVPVGQVIAMITAEVPDQLTTAPEPEPEATAESVEPAVTDPITSATVKVPITQPGRVLASPKARRLAMESGLDLSRLADVGKPQPYRAADVETLRNLPSTVLAPDMSFAPVASHIGAEVPIGNLEDFIVRMRDEGGAKITLSQILVGFSAAAYRSATGAGTILVVADDADGNRNIYQNADVLRLSMISGDTIDGSVQLEIKVLENSFVSSVILGGEAQPVLTAARNDQTLRLSLSFNDVHLEPDQAIEMMHDLSRRLADPLMALV